VETAFGGGHHALNEIEMRDQDFAGIEQPRFVGTGAAQAPELLGQFVDQDSFGFINRLMLGAEVGFELVERGGFFGADHQLFGIETVFEGVATGPRFAFRSGRSGAFLSIGAIGRQLGFCDHSDPRVA